MKILNEKDVAIANSILTNAFVENKSVNYVLKYKHNRRLISKLMDYSINKAKLYGNIWMNDKGNSCCILLDPLKKKTNLYSLWLDVKLLFSVVGIKNIKKVMHKESITNKYLPQNVDFMHLWFIGVDTAAQGVGIGSEFLEQIIDYYSDKKDAICLETSTLINLPFYQKLGFEVYHVENFGFDFYFLIKYLK